MQQYHPQAQAHAQVQTQSHLQAQYSPRQLIESARRAEADGNIDLAAHVLRYVVEHFAGSPESAEAYNTLLRIGQQPPEQANAPMLAPVPAHPSAQVMNGAYAPAASVSAPARFNANGASPAWAPPHAAPAHGFAPAPAAFAAPAPQRATPAAQTQAAMSAGNYGAQMQTPVQTIAATFAPATPYRAAEPAAKPAAMIHHAPEVMPQYRGGRIVARLAFAAGGLMILAGALTPVPALLGLIGPHPSLLGTGLVACALIATGLLALLGGQTALAVFDQADNMRELVELERTRWGA